MSLYFQVISDELNENAHEDERYMYICIYVLKHRPSYGARLNPNENPFGFLRRNGFNFPTFWRMEIPC